MKILIAEDDPISREVMFKFLRKYGKCDIAQDGLEAVELFSKAIQEKKIYDLVCLDIMMPKLDGIKALKTFRKLEKQQGVKKEQLTKVIMTSALNDKKTLEQSYHHGCELYIWKPIDFKAFKEHLKTIGLI